MHRDASSEAPSRTTSATEERVLSPGERGSERTLASYSILGASLDLLPLPWLPELAAKRVRGTLVHELCARRGLAITPEARAILAAPISVAGTPGKVLGPIVRFGIGRLAARLTPVGAVAPALSVLGTYLLGHLLGRWLDGPRPIGSARIDIHEAKRVHAAIDDAILFSLKRFEAQSPWKDLPRAPEELREGRDQVVDGVLMAVASLPPWFLARIEEGFDAALAAERGAK